MIQTKQDFATHIEAIQATLGYRAPIAFGLARVDRGQLDSNKILQASFPVVNWQENLGSAAIFLDALASSGVQVDNQASEFVCSISDNFIKHAMSAFNPFTAEASGSNHRNVQLISTLASFQRQDNFSVHDYRLVFLFEDAAPQSVEAVYLKLYALSQGKTELRSVNLNGAFGQLHNCAWVGNKPIELDWLRNNEIELKLSGNYPEVTMVDKFPRFLSHVIPADNTRILETSKVRFGAQLAAGTTVMPGASYINFNAGTQGAVMVEGRISSSAIVGAGSDVGGGASILGVLSGTDGKPVSIGENTLLGANSCTGTAIGNGCIIDAGVTILPGTKISLSDKAVAAISEANPEQKITSLMRGVDFSNVDGVHFRQDSVSGKIIAMRSTREVKLNEDLH